jgi:hypothetical protein
MQLQVVFMTIVYYLLVNSHDQWLPLVGFLHLFPDYLSIISEMDNSNVASVKHERRRSTAIIIIQC